MTAAFCCLQAAKQLEDEKVNAAKQLDEVSQQLQTLVVHDIELVSSVFIK